MTSNIDVQHTMKKKLGVDLPPYRILGTCNPTLAHQALYAVPDIGLLLPCNVIVREESPGRVVIGFLDPQIMLQLVGKSHVKVVADVAEQRLRRVCEGPRRQCDTRHITCAEKCASTTLASIPASSAAHRSSKPRAQQAANPSPKPLRTPNPPRRLWPNGPLAGPG